MDDPAWTRIRECAVELAGADFGGNQVQGHGGPAGILDAYRKADLFIRSSNRHGPPPRFDQFEALPPGSLDVRVFNQDTWWVDHLGTPHRIDNPDSSTDAAVIATIARLLHEAPVHHEAYTRAFPARTVPADPHAWLVGTVLMGALRARVSNVSCPSDSHQA